MISSCQLPVQSKKRKNDTSVSTYFIKTTPVHKKKLDIQVGRMIYATNSSFRIVEHREFKQTCSDLRPGYAPPSRYKIGNDILENVYIVELGKCKDKLKNMAVSVDLDGWSNTHNEPIICLTATTEDGENYLIKTIDTTGTSHTSENLIEIAIEAIEYAELTFNCKVRSFVTDNAANMTKMKDTLLTNNIITYGCAAHFANLLELDIEATLSNVTKHVIKIIKYFRNKHAPSALLKHAGGSKLTIPVETRWNTLTDSIENYLKNWSILFSICEDNEDIIDANIKNNVQSIALKRNCENLLKLIKPISVNFDKLQNDKTKISDVVEIFLNINEEICIIASEEQINILKNRYNQVITPYHLLANKLDPRYLGRRLSDADDDYVMNFELIPSLSKHTSPSIQLSGTLMLEKITMSTTIETLKILSLSDTIMLSYQV